MMMLTCIKNGLHVLRMAISIDRPCRRTHDFKNWRRKESYDKKSYDLKWQGVDKTHLHYHFYETGKILIKNIYKNTLITFFYHIFIYFIY